MTLGFTGTRRGATAAQLAAVRLLIERLAPDDAVDGDAVGADAQFRDLYREVTGRLGRSRPSTIARDRAFKPASKVYPAEHPLVRNAKIVADADVLVACPAEHTPQRRGGTWHTVRLAQEKRIPVAVVWPDGEVEEYAGGVPVSPDDYFPGANQ